MTLEFVVVRREEWEWEGKILRALWLRLHGQGSQDLVKLYVSEADYAASPMGRKFTLQGAP